MGPAVGGELVQEGGFFGGGEEVGDVVEARGEVGDGVGGDFGE